MTVDVGTRVAGQVLVDLPPGSVILQEHGDIPYRYVKAADLRWAQHTPEADSVPATGIYTEMNLRAEYLVEQIGKKKKAKMQESLAAYQWRFRTHILRSALENGVGLNRPMSGLTELGLNLDSASHPIGPDVPICRDETVPAGVVAYQGDPLDRRRFSVWVRRGSGWHLVWGAQTYADTVLKVATWPDRPEVPAWLTAPGTERDHREILGFKARAYRVGSKVRNSAGWCGVYDQVLARIGVTRQALSEAKTYVGAAGFGIGDPVNQTEARSLPEGTVVSWEDPFTPGRFAVYVRDDAYLPRNASGTRRLFGNDQDAGPLGNFRSGSRVRFLPDVQFCDRTDWDWHIGTSRQWLLHMPPGVFFRLGTEGTTYHVCRNGTITYGSEEEVRDSGPYTAGQFGTYEMYVKGFQG